MLVRTAKLSLLVGLVALVAATLGHTPTWSVILEKGVQETDPSLGAESDLTNEFGHADGGFGLRRFSSRMAANTIAAGEKQTITGTYYWDEPIVVESGGVLEFVDATIIGNFTREDEDALTERLYLLDNQGSVYVNRSRWEPYTYLPSKDNGEANIVYHSKGRLEIRDSLVIVDAESDNEWDYLGPIWVKGGRILVKDSALTNVSFWHGTPGMNSIGPMYNFTLENVEIWQNKTGDHVKSLNARLPGTVRHYGIFQTSRFGTGISGATTADKYNFHFLGSTFNGRPLYGKTIGLGEDVTLALGPDEPVGGAIYFMPAHDIGDISLSGGNWSEGQGVRFSAAQDGYQGPKGSVGDISVTDVSCGDFEGRGSCNFLLNAAWRRRGNVVVADNNFYSTTDVPRMGMSTPASANVTIERNWWHGNVSSAGAVSNGAVVRNNRVDGFGSLASGFRWYGDWMNLGSDSLAEGNWFGNISSAGNIFIIWAGSPVENITIRDNYFGNVSSNPDLDDIQWPIGFYSGTNVDPGDAYSHDITVTRNTFMGAEDWGRGWIFIAFGCICGTDYMIPFQVDINNNTFDARHGNSRQIIATNFGSVMIDSIIENNTFFHWPDALAFRLQNNIGTNILRNNTFIGDFDYRFWFIYHGIDPSAVYIVEDHLLDGRDTWQDLDGPEPPDQIVLRGNTMMFLQADDIYYHPIFAFEDYLVMGARGVEYAINTTRWLDDHATARFEGFTATVGKSGWFNLTVDVWNPDAPLGETAVAWTASSTASDVPTWFNATGLLPGKSYDLFVDGTKRASAESDGNGRASFLWSDWSVHSFELQGDPAGWTNTAPTVQDGAEAEGGTHNVTYGREVTASDPDTNQSLSWAMNTNASFLALEGNNRTAWVNGTPAHTDKHRVFYVNLSVSDGGCGGACLGVGYLNYTLYVNDTLPVILNKIFDDEGVVGEPYQRGFDAFDANGDALIWGLTTNGLFLGVDGRGIVSGTPPLAGTYYVNLTVHSSPVGDFVNYTLTVRPAPTPFEVESSYEILSENVVQFQVMVEPSGNYTYRWEFGDGDVSTERNPVHHYDYSFSGRYVVRLTVCSGNQCVQIVQQVALVKWSWLAVIVGFILMVAVYNFAVALRSHLFVRRELKGSGI